MKSDITIPEVKGITIAIARTMIEETGEFDWHAYLINKNDYYLENVMIVSSGYGIGENEGKKTATLRQLFEEVAPNSYTVIERVDPQVFDFVNEFFLTYYLPMGRDIHDKKFSFLPPIVNESNLIYIEFLEKEGVLHS